MSDLKGKVALVTGASSGIGAGTAVHLASLGCKLSITGRNKENLEKVAEQCKAAGLEGQNILLTLGDLSKEDDAKNVIARTLEHFKMLHILVNSAGILTTGTTENTSLESFDTIMNINVRSVFHLMQLAIPYLKQTKGNIVNVSSVTGVRAEHIKKADKLMQTKVPKIYQQVWNRNNKLATETKVEDFKRYLKFPGVMGYCVSKAAVDQLTRVAALELATDNVRVNAVNPGVIVTEIHKRGGMSEERYKQFLEHCKETHALGRYGTTDEVAKAIAFLASEDTASFITGVSLPIDGGRSQMCPR